MPANIEGYVAGNSIDIQNDVPGVATSDPLVKAWVTFKVRPTDADPGALQKEITTTFVGGVGQIVQDGGPSTGNGTGTVRFILTKANTLALGSTIRYYYDIRAKSASGNIYNAVLDDTVDPPISVGSMLLERSITEDQD